MDRIVRRFRVVGRVQGVYFRHSTRLEASRLAIRGLARNLPDGSVEVLAEGSPAAVEALRLWLHRGPDQARVEGVQELTPDGDAGADAETAIPDGFEIR